MTSVNGTTANPATPEGKTQASGEPQSIPKRQGQGARHLSVPPGAIVKRSGRGNSAVSARGSESRNPGPEAFWGLGHVRRGRTPRSTPPFSLSGAGAAPRPPSRLPGARRPGTAVSSRAHVLRSQSARAKAGDDARWGHPEAPSPTRLLVADRGRAVMGTPTTGFLAARRLLWGQRPADPHTWPPGPWAQAAWTQGGGTETPPPAGRCRSRGGCLGNSRPASSVPHVQPASSSRTRVCSMAPGFHE